MNEETLHPPTMTPENAYGRLKRFLDRFIEPIAHES
jgi:hypothetical protein